MLEWGIPFDHIENHWTDRQYVAMVRARDDRIKQESKRHKETKPQSTSRR